MERFESLVLKSRPAADIPRIIVAARGHQTMTFHSGVAPYAEGFRGDPSPAVSVEVTDPNWVNVRLGKTGEALHLTSHVLAGGEKMRIPMVDFQNGEGYPAAVHSSLRGLLSELGFPSGIISQTENGFHFIGVALVSPEGFSLMLEELGASVAKFPHLNREWLERAQVNKYAQLPIARRSGSGIGPIPIDQHEPKFDAGIRAIYRYGVS